MSFQLVRRLYQNKNETECRTECRAKLQIELNAEQKCKVQHKYQLQQEIGNLLFRVMRMTTLLLALFIQFLDKNLPVVHLLHTKISQGPGKGRYNLWTVVRKKKLVCLRARVAKEVNLIVVNLTAFHCADFKQCWR